MRQLKREVKIGNVTIGGNHPIAVQTMLNVPDLCDCKGIILLSDLLSRNPHKWEVFICTGHNTKYFTNDCFPEYNEQ